MLRARAPVTGLALVAHSGTPGSPCAGCCGQCVRPSGRRPGRPPRPDAPQASRITCRPAALPPCRPARRPASLVTTPPAPATGAGYTPMAINGSSTAVCAACGPGTYKSTPGRCCRAVLPRSRACGASVCARAGAFPCRCMCATPRGVALIPRPVYRTRGRAMRGTAGPGPCEACPDGSFSSLNYALRPSPGSAYAKVPEPATLAGTNFTVCFCESLDAPAHNLSAAWSCLRSLRGCAARCACTRRLALVTRPAGARAPRAPRRVRRGHTVPWSGRGRRGPRPTRVLP